MLSRAALGAAILFLAGCAGAPAPDPVAGARGHLFIVGGGPRPAEVMDPFIELAGGRGRAKIAVVPMSSADPAAAGESLVEQMKALGAAEVVNLNLTREQALDPASAELLDGVTGVWFAGGVQSRHTAVLLGTPVIERIHELYRGGAVIGGTSAGAAIMSEIMITGGEKRPGGDRPVDSGAYITIDRDNIGVDQGFGFLPGAIVDQHFVRRKRNNRLISVVLEHPDRIGVGIDESTAVVVGPDGRWTIVGRSVAVVYDARGAEITAVDAPGALGGAGIRMHVLPAGSVFDPSTGEATLPAVPEAVAESVARAVATR